MKKLTVLLLLAALVAAMLTVPALAEEPVKLVLWNPNTDSDVFDVIAADFCELHPEIEIEVVTVATEDMRNTLKMALTSGTGPDLFYYDSGPGYMGALADAGLVLELTDAAEEFGWADTLDGWALNAGKYKDVLYGVASEYEMLCVYYNKQIYADLGLEIPTTYDEFLANCAAAKEAGILPIVLDDLDKWPGYHYESLYFGAFGGPDMVNAALEGTLEGGWNQPEFAEALNALAALGKEGYISEFPNGIAHDDGLREFYTGGGAMYMTGTWQVNGMYENMGDNVGLFIFPAAKEGLPNVPPVGVGSAWQISAVTEHPHEAAMVVDYFFKADGGAKTWMQKSEIVTPADVDTSDMEISPLFQEVLVIKDTVDIYNQNIDVLVTQAVNDATGNYIQQVLDGMITGEEAVALKQAAAEQG